MIDYQTFTTKATPEAERRLLRVGDIWSNAIRCLSCGDTIRSTNRHDYRSCSCGAVAVDGGSWYAKVVGNPGSFEWLTEYYDDVQ